MTSPLPPPPHHDPVLHTDLSKVTMMEYTTTLIASLDRRFDTLHQDLKDSISDRFLSADRLLREMDLRYQQRDDARQEALKDALIAADKAVNAALTAADRAVVKAESAAEKRFDSVNEFRAQLADQAATFMPRSEALALFKSVTEKIDDLKAYQSASVGREAAVPNTAKQIQDIADQVQVLRDYRESSRGSNLEARVKELSDQLLANSKIIDTGQGRSSGLASGWGYLVAGVGLIVVVVNVFIAVINK